MEAGISGIRDFTKIHCGIRENVDGMRDLTAALEVVCYTAVFSVVTQCSSTALRDDSKNGCVADYPGSGIRQNFDHGCGLGKKIIFGVAIKRVKLRDSRKKERETRVRDPAFQTLFELFVSDFRSEINDARLESLDRSFEDPEHPTLGTRLDRR